MSIFEDTLKRCLAGALIEYSEDQIKLCYEYFRLVEEANKRLNLTRITDEAGAAEQHFADAAMLFKFTDIPLGARVIDIGTGAGFPGIPLKIMRPDIDMTLLDSSGKKMEFVKGASERLVISVTVIAERAEEAANGLLRETFDIVLSRAVAPLNMLLELCAPFVKVGGVFAAWKGESYKAELEDAQSALSILGCYVKSENFIDPGAIILIEKIKATPEKYPRRFAKIKAQPL